MVMMQVALLAAALCALAGTTLPKVKAAGGSWGEVEINIMTHHPTVISVGKGGGTVQKVCFECKRTNSCSGGNLLGRGPSVWPNFPYHTHIHRCQSQHPLGVTQLNCEPLAGWPLLAGKPPLWCYLLSSRHLSFRYSFL
uniref:Putative secreted protein n=1 Tax=Anopheles marajoara TaxID=58244 RepID=A0A2M4C6N3_9DIPT